jgi:hypothetical protein
MREWSGRLAKLRQKVVMSRLCEMDIDARFDLKQQKTLILAARKQRRVFAWRALDNFIRPLVMSRQLHAQ